jgi:kinesin family protein 11
MSGRHDKEKGVNVQVLLRCRYYIHSFIFLITIFYHIKSINRIVFFSRPFSEDELRTNAPQVVTCNDYNREVSVSQNVAGKHFDRVFTFDKVNYSSPSNV